MNLFLKSFLIFLFAYTLLLISGCSPYGTVEFDPADCVKDDGVVVNTKPHLIGQTKVTRKYEVTCTKKVLYTTTEYHNE